MPTNRKTKVRARREKTGESYQSALRNIRAAEDGSTVSFLPDELLYDQISTNAPYATYDAGSGAYVDAFGQIVLYDGRPPIRVPFIQRPEAPELGRLVRTAILRVASRLAVDAGSPVHEVVAKAMTQHAINDLTTDRFLVNPLDLDAYRKELDKRGEYGAKIRVEGDATIPRGEALVLCEPAVLGVIGKKTSTGEVAILIHNSQGALYLAAKAEEKEDKMEADSWQPFIPSSDLTVFKNLLLMTIAVMKYLLLTGGTTATYDSDPHRRTMGFRIGEARFHVPLTSIKEIPIPPKLRKIWSALEPISPDEPVEARWNRVGTAIVASAYRRNAAVMMKESRPVDEGAQTKSEQAVPEEDVNTLRELFYVARQDPDYSVVVTDRPTEKTPPPTHEDLARDLKDRIASMWKSPEIVACERRLNDVAFLIEAAVFRFNKLVRAHEFGALSWKADDNVVNLCVQVNASVVPERHRVGHHGERVDVFTLTFTLAKLAGGDRHMVTVTLHLDLIQSDAPDTWWEPFDTFDAAKVDHILTTALDRAMQSIPLGPKPG